MDIAKKSYEISLWDEQLIWHRRKLRPICVKEKDYTPGKFFSQSTEVYGAVPYTLDLNKYNDGQVYYEIDPSSEPLEGYSPESINVEERGDWKNAEQIKVIWKDKNFDNQFDSSIPSYFTYSNNTNSFTKVANEELAQGPQKDKIYFINKEAGETLTPNEAFSYYKETRLCTIGSSSMESLARCVNPKLVSKVNGENTLTFTMYYQYIDTETGEKTYNPFIKYMVNERKVKLNYDGDWYDFVIKQIQENSETRAFTYTCKDQFMIELSKTGFDIVLDNELENNMGTVKQLAETILEGSDWKLAESDNLMQFVEEPLYKVKVANDTELEVEVMNPINGETKPNIAGEYIYIFYSHINDQKEDLQFLYDVSGKFETNDDLIIDKDKYPNYLIRNVQFTKSDSRGNLWPDFTASGSAEDLYDAVISSDYRGMRLVRQIQTKYDSTIDKFVQVYKKEGDENTIYYGFTEAKYVSPNTVNNLIVNPNAFTSTTGWYTEKINGVRPILELTMDPPPTEYKEVISPKKEELPIYFEKGKDGYIKSTDTDIVNGKVYYTLSLNSIFSSYLKLPANDSDKSYRLMNSSVNSYKSSLEEFVVDQTKFVLRMRYKKGATGNNWSETAPVAKLGRYQIDSGESYSFVKIVTQDTERLGSKVYYIYDPERDKYEVFNGESFNTGITYYEDDILFNFSSFIPESDELKKENFIYMADTCARSVSKAELRDWENRYGLFFTFEGKTDIFIEDVQLFPHLEYNGELCVPGGELFSEIKTTQKYYKPSKTYTSVDDVVFEPEGGKYILQYNEGANAYTKVASITAKESNRFNLLQDLNEKFECWAHFNIDHNYDGSIKLGKDVGILTGDEAYRQQKFVSFHEYAGREEFNYASFRYGINSKSIQRTLDSNAIASKLIVKDNANEFAPNGFCSIARASENPTKENFLLNFDHYYHQRLLDLDIVTNDLYVDANGYLGYYKKLKRLNANRDSDINLQANLLIDISNYEASYQTYKLSYDAAIEEKLVAEDNIRLLIVPEKQRKDYADKPFEVVIATFASQWEEDEAYIKYITKWAQCKNVETQHGPLYLKAEKDLKQFQEDYENIEKRLKELAEQKRALNLQFYKKYSRFIQEGSWIKEDYVDDNLYYLDSVSTLHTSAQPKVTYNISVIDISQIPGFESYVFKLGDKTYIEDVEFFGYSLIDRNAPYREEIVVSEMTFELDSPEKNQIKVQNYKTQFEDLFQRITAQTQQAEYHTGEYKRAASIVEKDGTIALSTLENSFSNNSLKLQNARDQSVVIDEYGITSTSLANPSEMVRIVAGGIFMSTDGGQSWKTGLTGHGLNSSYLTTGQVNADEINIMSGSQPAFRWDAKGLSAYLYETDEAGQTYNYNTKKYVRFDRFGIYGIENETEDMVLNSVDSVMSNAAFALTWNGFSLRNSDGSVKITSSKDIQVLSGENERIKIGRIGYEYVKYDGALQNDQEYYELIDEANNIYKETEDLNRIEGKKYFTKEKKYGLSIRDSAEQVVMETGSDGKLWLRDALNIGVTEESTVQIGYLNEVKDGAHAILKAGDEGTQFIVYENGQISLTGAEISGKIEAQEGKIGCLTVDGEVLKIIKPLEDETSKDIVVMTYNGIEINDAGFNIKIDEKQVFGIVDGNLIMTGKIIATDGEFGGKLVSPEGQIGGFILSEGALTSADGNIVLKGVEGSIVANNITLGTSATITEYIKLGNAFIRNPEISDNIFIESSGLIIKDDGTFNVGNGIVINGPNETIQSADFSSGSSGWQIGANSAEFNEVTVRGTLKTSVFSYEEVQAVGGIMLVRPSSTIREIVQESDGKVWIVVDDPALFEIGTICQIAKDGEQSLYKVASKDVNTRLHLTTLTGNVNLNKLPKKLDVLINFLSVDEENQVGNNIGIAINSSSSSASYPDQAITVFETVLGEGESLQKTPKIKLGKMSAEKGDLLDGYGLYADNVYLNGRLVTGSEFAKYSGFDGHSEITEDESNDNSQILLWAGALSQRESDIKSAPFRVDSEGNLYANKGRFSGAIISDSTIQATKIETATLVGNGNNPALRIIDTSEGIEFCDYLINEDKETFSTTFKITHSGQQIKVSENEFFSFIDLSENNVAFQTKRQGNQPSVIIKDNFINIGDFFLRGQTDKIALECGDLKFEINSVAEKVQFETPFIEYGERMRYSRVNDGYDLYVL